MLQYVAAHGRIARRDAAEFCKVHPKQASRILARLTRRGELVMHGKKRGTWYGLPEDGDTKFMTPAPQLWDMGHNGYAHAS